MLLNRAGGLRPVLSTARLAARSSRATRTMATAVMAPRSISISSGMDAGNIEVVSTSSPDNIQLRIKPDPFCQTDNREHYQWFSFRVAGARGERLTLKLTNAGGASFPGAWNGYQACASHDHSTWFRVPTKYDSSTGVLTISHAPERDTCHYAYFPPYSMDRHHQLIHRMQARPGVKHVVLGQTIDGQDMDLLQIGEPGPGKRNIWVIARQHPGETMAEWFMEGMLERLTSPHDPVARTLLAKAVVYAVPNMCPDGSRRGHLRTNAAGVNLNRAWAQPCEQTSPEAFCVLRAMKEAGVDFLADVHGDEDLPYNFVVSNAGIPKWTPRLANLEMSFKEAFKRHSPDFQTEHGYPTDSPGRANMTLCSKAVGQMFDCLSLTLEQPFKDNAMLPDELRGWSPERSMHLGEAMLGAVLDVLPKLRD